MSLNIVATGDFCPTEHVEAKLLVTQDPKDFFGDALCHFDAADLVITNLEYPLTLKGREIRKYGSHQKGNPSTVSLLKESGINLVSLANNHIFDYGQEGILDTLSACESHGLDTVGAGPDLKSAQKIYYKEINGWKIAVIAFCENEFSIATHDHGGAAPLDIINNYRQIQEARENADIVIVVIHGGNEFSHFPSPYTVKLYRFFADSGASAVIAHHPHYIQGYEFYKGTPIIYSLGKFIYTRMKDPGLLEVPIVQLKFSRPSNNCSVNYFFYKLSLEKIGLENFTPDEEMELRRRFNYYCSAIQDPAQLLDLWKSYCYKNKNLYYAMITLSPGIIFRILRRLKLIDLYSKFVLFQRNQLIKVQDLISCESHREVILALLKDL